MKRALSSALLFLALPGVGFATTVYTTGLFSNGTSSGSAKTSLGFTVNGSLASITVDTGALTQLSSCANGAPGTCFSFTSGNVIVTHRGSLLFDHDLSSGMIEQDGRVFIVEFSLKPGPGVFPASAGQSIFLLTSSPPVGNFAGTMSFGTTTVAVFTPEPGSLGLLGTGVIALAGLTRRKLKPQALDLGDGSSQY
jgi:hypothetical protein